MDAGSMGRRVTGIVLVSLGGTSLLIGGEFLIVLGAFDNVFTPTSNDSGFAEASWAAFGGGVLALTIGVLMIVDSKTVIAQKLDALPETASLPRGERRLDVGHGQPSPALPQATSLPIVDFRF